MFKNVCFCGKKLAFAQPKIYRSDEYFFEEFLGRIWFQVFAVFNKYIVDFPFPKLKYTNNMQ